MLCFSFNKAKLLCVSLLTALAVNGQSLSGKVISAENGAPVYSAAVYLPDFGIGTFSDSSGYFELRNDLPESVKISIKADGFETILTTILIAKSPVVLKLKEKHLELDEVIVSNNQGALQRNNSIHIETRKLSDLNGIPGTNLTESLTNIPGVYSSSTGTGISKPVIRGVQGIRVLTMLNGLRIENQQWGGDHGLGITELGIGSVEVIKGPSSLLYGADALGGVVYFIDEPYARNNTHELNVKTQVESVSMSTKSQMMLKTARKNYRLSIGGLYNNQADYQLPNGKFAQNSRFFDQAAKLAFATNKGKWSMHLRYNFSHTRSGIPGHTHDSIVDPSKFQVENQNRSYTVPAQVFFNHFLSFENKFFLKRNELTLLTGQTFNRLTEFEEKLTIPGIQADLHNSLYSVKLKSHLTEHIFIVSGLQGMFQNNINSSKATEQLIPDALTMDNGAFVIGYYEGKYWNFQAGIRYDIRQLRSLETFKGTSPITRNYQGLNYSLGAVRTTEKQTIRGNISSGFRAPHLSELLANGFHHGALRYEIGSTELKAENAVQLDLTYEYHGEHLEVILNPFTSLLSNYIYLNPLDTVIASLPVFEYVQLEDGFSYGVDAGWHYHPHFAHWLHVENSFSYVMIRGNDDFQVSLLPQSRISTLLKVAVPMKSKFRLDDFSIQHLYYFRQTNVAAFETASPAYQVVNIGLNAQLKGNVPLNFQLGVKNVLNSRYIDHLSRLKNIDLPFPGRNFYLSIAYQLINNHKVK